MQVPNENVVSQTIKSTQLKINQLARILPIRTELHLFRKIWHMMTGLAIISVYMSGVSQATILSFLIPFFFWTVAMEVWRLKNPLINEKCIRFFSVIIRSNEVHRVSGVPYYIASSIVAVGIFPKPVAILSLFYLALGDPLASLFGILFSNRSVKIFNGSKSLHGTAAGYCVCAIVTWLYLRSTGMHGLDLIRLTLLGGFAGALAELLPLDIDDNFTIPVVSGFILWLGFIAVHFV
ncbi:MAG: diacylglycerol/polyprenol kinase family protein [Bdellovibrionota bacterium]